MCNKKFDLFIEDELVKKGKHSRLCMRMVSLKYDIIMLTVEQVLLIPNAILMVTHSFGKFAVIYPPF